MDGDRDVCGAEPDGARQGSLLATAQGSSSRRSLGRQQSGLLAVSAFPMWTCLTPKNRFIMAKLEDYWPGCLTPGEAVEVVSVISPG